MGRIIESRMAVQPTWYKDILMESKTEAQFAMILDAFGFEWDYEPHTYKRCGIRYTPDFVLKDKSAMFEVKPIARLGEIDRIVPVVEELGKVFMVASPRVGSFRGKAPIFYIPAMYSPLRDSYSMSTDSWGWTINEKFSVSVSLDRGFLVEGESYGVSACSAGR